MIREAELSDLAEVLRMGRLFTKSLGIPLDAETTLETAPLNLGDILANAIREQALVVDAIRSRPFIDETTH